MIIFIFSLCSLFLPTLAWNEATLVFLNFVNFVAIFLEFSITPRVRMERKDNLYFLSFAAFSCLFWLEMKPQWYFLIFFVIFLEFSITHRVGTMGNDNFYFLSIPAFSNLFWLQTKSQWYFLIFLPFFWNFLSCLR